MERSRKLPGQAIAGGAHLHAHLVNGVSDLPSPEKTCMAAFYPFFMLLKRDLFLGTGLEIQLKLSSSVTVHVIYFPLCSQKLGAYNSSKTAILGLAKTLAVELAPKNIGVNCLVPGLIDTTFSQVVSTKDNFCPCPTECQVSSPTKSCPTETWPCGLLF